LLVGDPSCLVADERVVMADGTIMKIGEMGSRHLQKIDYKVHLGMGWKVGKANRFHAYKKQPIIEIVTETGKSIKGTYNQPVLVVENRKQSWKRLDEVKIGNKVQVIPKIKCNRKSLVETNWKDYPYYHKSWHIKIPKFVDEDLAGLFGYFIADGWIQKRRVGFVVNKDEIDILSKIKNALKKCFDVGVNMYEYERANPKIYYYQIDRKHIAKLLSFLNEKRVPNCIFQSRNSVVSSFLRWLYEGDGSVFSKGHGLTSISLKSKHIELLRDVQILLLRFGIHSRIVWEDAHRHTKIKNREITSSPSGSLMIRRSESIIKFWQNIGFISKKKNNKLKQAVKYAKTHIHKVHKNRAEKIVKINKLSPQDVFDIEVPKYHRFVANGIVVHNTAKSVLMKVVSTLIPRGRYVSGKGVSVDWDDPIIYRENGSVKTDLIGNVIDKFYQTKKDGLVNVSNIQVPAFNFKDFKIEWKPVRYVYRHKIDEPLIKLTLRTNRTVKITPSHSIYTIENSSVMEKKASEIKEGDFILIPRKLPQNEKQIVKINLAKELNKIPENERKHIVVENGYLKSKFSNHKIPVEIPVDENLMRLLGYYVAEGSLHEVKGNTWKVEFDFGDNDNENIEDVKRIVKSIFNVDVNVNSKRESKGYDVTINDKIVFLIFKYILKVSIGAKRKKVPEIVFNSSKKAQLEFIKGWVRGDYGVTTSKELMSDIQYLLLLNNIIASFSERTIKRRIDFSDHISYVDTKVYELKSPKVTEILKNNFDISRLHGYIPLKIFNSEKILNLKKSKYKRISKSALKILFSRYNSLLYERLEMLAKNIGVNELSKIYKINRKSALQYLNSLTKKGYLLKSHKDNKIKYILSDKGKFLLKEIKLVKLLTSSDLGFVEIKKIEKVKPSGNFVYDLSVENCENFVAGFGGVCCHNTGAGLTATVVKDEEFLGGWVLEAGALVMCNKSLICIDEFEKIEKTDQIALHEAMEQNTISIAKASIVATLPAQTAILGGGNPKFGRFDPYLPIKEQIDIPETLLARFDLKFALRDIPNPEMDTKIAEYILKARHYGEEEIKPIIDSEFLKKYVAYARKNCHPKLSKDAGEEIKNFFVGLREKVVSEESPVPITLRQYEGLIRLAEASAKLHLRNIVTKEDAIRAVNLMKASLRQFGFDTETGKFDIDRLEGRVPAVERGKIRTMIDVIEELSKTFGNAIPKEEIVNLAKNRGMKEFDIEKILNELKNKGELFEPRIGIFQKM
jgi:intein/homing endonuclease/MoxR-like ATPase